MHSFPQFYDGEARDKQWLDSTTDQGFDSLVKRAHYSASITEAKAMRPKILAQAFMRLKRMSSGKKESLVLYIS